MNPALIDRPTSRALPCAEHLPQLDCSANLAALHVIGGLNQLSQLSFHESTVSSLRLARSLESTTGLSVLILACTFFWRHGVHARRGLLTFWPSRPTRNVSSISPSSAIPPELQVDVRWTVLHDEAEMVANRKVTACGTAASFPKWQSSQNGRSGSARHIWL
jgi:hypothetical protein